MEKLFIIIPAYNEEENIQRLISEWYPIIEKNNGNKQSRLVVIDDGSKDDTYNLLLQLKENRPLLTPLTKKNAGHGPTLLYGYKYAIDNDADYIFQTDSDGQTNADEFKKFWNLRNEYDAIIGNRPDRKDGRSRKFVEKILVLLLRIIFKVKIPDANAPFRLMKTSLVKKYINKMPDNFNLPNVMFTTYFSYYNEKIKFLNIEFKNRQGGKNSINIKKITKIGIQAIGDFRRFKIDMKKV